MNHSAKLNRTELQTASIAKAIRSFRFTYANEEGLQDGITEALRSTGFQVEKEVRLDGRSRIDLLIVDNEYPPICVGVEIKVADSITDVLRQLQRYAPHVDGLVLVTTRSRHGAIHEAAVGVPYQSVYLGGRGL